MRNFENLNIFALRYNFSLQLQSNAYFSSTQKNFLKIYIITHKKRKKAITLYNEAKFKQNCL
jgi:hypothetical protein